MKIIVINDFDTYIIDDTPDNQALVMAATAEARQRLVERKATLAIDPEWAEKQSHEYVEKRFAEDDHVRNLPLDQQEEAKEKFDDEREARRQAKYPAWCALEKILGDPLDGYEFLVHGPFSMLLEYF